MQRRLAQLPLHGGQAPAWLFQRMKRLAGVVTMAVVDAHGPEEMLRRLADPAWFQAFGCVLGFDWHRGFFFAPSGAWCVVQHLCVFVSW